MRLFSYSHLNFGFIEFAGTFHDGSATQYWCDTDLYGNGTFGRSTLTLHAAHLPLLCNACVKHSAGLESGHAERRDTGKVWSTLVVMTAIVLILEGNIESSEQTIPFR